MREPCASLLTAFCDWAVVPHGRQRGAGIRLLEAMTVLHCCWQGSLQGCQDDMVGNTSKGCMLYRACHSGAADKQSRAPGRRRALGAACAMAALFGAASALAPAFWWCVR